MRKLAIIPIIILTALPVNALTRERDKSGDLLYRSPCIRTDSGDFCPDKNRKIYSTFLFNNCQAVWGHIVTQEEADRDEEEMGIRNLIVGTCLTIGDDERNIHVINFDK